MTTSTIEADGTTLSIRVGSGVVDSKINTEDFMTAKVLPTRRPVCASGHRHSPSPINQASLTFVSCYISLRNSQFFMTIPMLDL
jgi:hypothetical protein